MLLHKPAIKITATILAKNEADIIGQQIEHHIEQGVSNIIFTDNNSSDKTIEIAAKYPEVKEIIEEPGNDHNQSRWVSRMAQEAIKLKPDWIIHLDADEFWVGLGALKSHVCEVVGCEGMYLHPPINHNFNFHEMRHYLDLDHISLPQECKIAHRPIPNIVISHGNHGVEGHYKQGFTNKIRRHHFPIRSYDQWERKAMGHLALQKRNHICKRWERWHQLHKEERLRAEFDQFIQTWKAAIESPEQADFPLILKNWCEPEILERFKTNAWIPKIKSWP